MLKISFSVKYLLNYLFLKKMKYKKSFTVSNKTFAVILGKAKAALKFVLKEVAFIIFCQQTICKMSKKDKISWQFKYIHDALAEMG